MNADDERRPAAEEKSLEQALTEVERIVHELEEGQIGLSAALERFEQGVRLIDFCHRQLARAEQRIELLTGIDAQGQPVTRPFEESRGESLEEEAKSRSRKRSAAPPKSLESNPTSPSGVDEGGGLF